MKFGKSHLPVIPASAAITFSAMVFLSGCAGHQSASLTPRASRAAPTGAQRTELSGRERPDLISYVKGGKLTVMDSNSKEILKDVEGHLLALSREIIAYVDRNSHNRTVFINRSGQPIGEPVDTTRVVVSNTMIAYRDSTHEWKVMNSKGQIIQNPTKIMEDQSLILTDSIMAYQNPSQELVAKDTQGNDLLSPVKVAKFALKGDLLSYSLDTGERIVINSQKNKLVGPILGTRISLSEDYFLEGTNGGTPSIFNFSIYLPSGEKIREVKDFDTSNINIVSFSGPFFSVYYRTKELKVDNYRGEEILSAKDVLDFKSSLRLVAYLTSTNELVLTNFKKEKIASIRLNHTGKNQYSLGNHVVCYEEGDHYHVLNEQKQEILTLPVKDSIPSLPTVSRSDL